MASGAPNLDMSSDIQSRMLSAVFACLLPLARLLLRSGITYRQFDAVAKRAFVREASLASDPRGRGANTSRVAVMTGLSRKDVRRLREQSIESGYRQAELEEQHWGPPARVLHAWHVDSRFVDQDGRPRKLQFQDEESGFSALVRAVAGDVPPGAVRAELRRCGAISELSDGSIEAVKRYYVPGNVDEKAITTISGMLFPMTAGLAHNTNPGRTVDGFIQRFAFSDSVPMQKIPEFRRWSRQEATAFIERIDDWLAIQESSRAATSTDSDGLTVGVGVFYYEGPGADRTVKSSR